MMQIIISQGGLSKCHSSRLSVLTSSSVLNRLRPDPGHHPDMVPTEGQDQPQSENLSLRVDGLRSNVLLL